MEKAANRYEKKAALERSKAYNAEQKSKAYSDAKNFKPKVYSDAYLDQKSDEWHDKSRKHVKSAEEYSYAADQIIKSAKEKGLSVDSQAFEVVVRDGRVTLRDMLNNIMFKNREGGGGIRAELTGQDTIITAKHKITGTQGSERSNPTTFSKYSNAKWDDQEDFLGTTSGTTKMDFGNKKMRVYASDIKTAGRIMDRIDRDEKKITSAVNDAVMKTIKDTKRRETTYGGKATADYLSKRNPYETLAIDGITILNSSGRGKDKIAVFVRDNVTGDLWETDLDATTLKILEEPWIEG